MNKRLFSFVLILVIFISFIGQASGVSAYSINLKNSNEIAIESPAYGSNMRIMVEKGSEKYYYSLNNEKENIPVQLGNGSYTVKILKNTSGNSYKVVDKSTLSIKNNSLDVYLSSSQPVYWEGKEKVLGLANTLTKGLITDTEKVISVYNYIIKNVKYDYNKINVVSTDYVPDLEKIIAENNGLCYDYAALFAGILRSQGIHTKLVKGYKNDMKAYHAWNEVLIEGKWVTIDTTYDAALANSTTKTSMIKSANEYNKVREY